MSDRIEVTLEGGEELIAALRELDLSVRSTLRSATLAGAEVIVAAADGLAPGPHIDAEVTSASASKIEVAIGPDEEHWYYRFFETGTQPHEIEGSPLLAFEGDEGWVRTRQVAHKGMAARPFLRPAHDEKSQEAQDQLGAVVRERIEQVKAAG